MSNKKNKEVLDISVEEKETKKKPSYLIGIVNVPALNVREEGDVESKILGIIKKGDKVKILDYEERDKKFEVQPIFVKIKTKIEGKEVEAFCMLQYLNV